jgi:hypothetical protein
MEHHTAVSHLGMQILAPSLPLEAANLINVRVVGREVQSKGDLHGPEPVVLDPQLLVTDTTPEKPLESEMERTEWNPHPSVAEKVWVSKGNGQLIVFIPDGRTQEERSAPL